ncbi:uncharacterized protein RSE6_11804 [Rhynchosporium secalis]|uniref:Microbial-type PARG catalytic domain-containing protein n=1 Tax=Rhynchosporium secalis TaxID=38038 RepID=A0A1E1MNY6_RHYSE|nr:uncharacterized protein RSE6_11804 [Rhynchosporium secalis]
MPPSKLKPSEIAAEAKKKFIPYILATMNDKWPASSYLCYSESIEAQPPKGNAQICRFAFYEMDPIDLALDWAEPGDAPIPVIMPANDKRPGGDWEAGVMSPEECLCRRSNLIATLTTPGEGSCVPSNYPMPSSTGIYSGNVVVFRDGPEKYTPWPEYKSLPIISVCPVKRPKLNPEKTKYSFKDERELMRDKIRTALRIAVYYKHINLVIGTFGLGPGFCNPTEEVALMWRDAFLKDPEFMGHFRDVVFAFEAPEGPGTPTSSSSKGSSSKSSSKSTSKSSSKSSSSSSKRTDLDVFRHVFKPANVHNAFKTPMANSCEPSSSEVY